MNIIELTNRAVKQNDAFMLLVEEKISKALGENFLVVWHSHRAVLKYTVFNRKKRFGVQEQYYDFDCKFDRVELAPMRDHPNNSLENAETILRIFNETIAEFNCEPSEVTA